MPDIVVNPKEPVEVKSSDGSRVYWIKPPEAWEGDKFAEAVLAEGARSWARSQLMESLSELILAPEAGDGEEEIAERQRLAAIIDGYLARFREALERERNERTAEAREEARALWKIPPEVEEIESLVLGAGQTKYSRMLSENAAYGMKSGRVAARMFLRGWEGIETPFRKGLGGVPDELLRLIPPEDRVRISNKIHELIAPEEFRVGNSESGPSGSSSPKSLPATKTQPRKSPSKETDGTSPS